MSNQSIPTWQDRMPAPRQQKYCTMNCSGGPWPHPCEDCGTETVHGSPIVAAIAEIADLRAALAALSQPRAKVSDAEKMDFDESREYLVKFMRAHFTDKTFAPYIRDQLAGDFAYEMANALLTTQGGARDAAIVQAALEAAADKADDWTMDFVVEDTAPRKCGEYIRAIDSQTILDSVKDGE